MKSLAFGTGLVLSAATIAGAADNFLVTRGDTLYRYDGNSIATFTLSDTFHSLSSTDLGIIGFSNLQIPGSDPHEYEAWRLTHPTGVPGLDQIGSILQQRFPTISQVGNTLYGIGNDAIYTIANDLSLTFVSSVDSSGNIGGSGYDASTDTFYVTGGNANALYTLSLGSGVLSQIGTDVGFDFRNQGGEWWNGQYWAALEDVTNDRLVLGTIDTTTGIFNLEVVLQDGLGVLGENQTVGLAVIPSPSSLALLGLGGLAAVRRRR